MSIIYELMHDKDNWSYILTVDELEKLTLKEKLTISEITYAIQQSIKILNYKGE